MGNKDSGPGGTSKRPNGTTGRNRNAYCSFCKKSFRDVGPLVEGPGEVYICGERIELCQAIIDQEKRRRNSHSTPGMPSRAEIEDRVGGWFGVHTDALRAIGTLVRGHCQRLSEGAQAADLPG